MRYTKTVAFRVDPETDKLIMDAWKKMKGYVNRSDVLRDLVRIGAAIVLNTPVELESGTVVRVENPVVSIHVPSSGRGSKKYERALSNIHRKVREAINKLQIFRNVLYINDAIVVKTKAGDALKINRESFVSRINDVLHILSEVLTIIESVHTAPYEQQTIDSGGGSR